MNRISKEDFLKLNEEDVMFITNPGRTGDEDDKESLKYSAIYNVW